ncbi:MAG: MaoC/PaaZ C-terminal domain-containing protein [Haloarcula sp.]
MAYSYEPHAIDDLATGQTFETPGRTITETDVVMHASLTSDWTELHTNVEYASDGQFGERIVHGPFTYAVATGLFLRTGVFARTLRAFLGMTYMEIPHPTVVGDTLSVTATVAECRDLDSRPDVGLVRVDLAVTNQTDESVMAFDLKFLVDSHLPAAADDPADVASDSPDSVDDSGNVSSERND